jgi:hypothetical protein
MAFLNSEKERRKIIVVFFLINSPTQRLETNKNSVKRAGPAQKSSVYVCCFFTPHTFGSIAGVGLEKKKLKGK